MKVCSKCGIEKDDGEFYKGTKQCKSCVAEIRKTHYQKNRQDMLCQKKEYRARNKDKITTKKKEYYQENRENILCQKKEHYQENKECFASYKKEYYKINKGEILRKNSERKKKRLLEDPYYKLTENLRCRIAQGFKYFSLHGKTKSCKEYGIDFQAIYEKLGPPPTPTCHCDHVIPMSKFCLDIPEHVKMCNSAENLQWLEGTDNCSKNDTVPYDIIYCSLKLIVIAKKIGII